MTITLIELTEEEFDDRYPLLPNHINPTASWVLGEGRRGCMFETYGDDFEYVRRFDPQRVWTLVDGEDGDLYLVNGLHFVNRIGYLLSHEAVPDCECVQVHIPMTPEDEP